MSSSTARDEHDEVKESVALYAVDSLPSDEAAAIETHLAACAACQRELQTVRAVVAAFGAWPTDVLRPSPTLWDDLTRQIASEKGEPFEIIGRTGGRDGNPSWERVTDGLEYKLLSTDVDTQRVSLLVRLAPGAAYPPHRHAGVEELYLLDGELWIDDLQLFPGDYNRAEAGTADQRVWSETGCTCVLLTSARDVLES